MNIRKMNFTMILRFLMSVFILTSPNMLMARDYFQKDTCYGYQDSKQYIEKLNYKIISMKYNIYFNSGVTFDSVMSNKVDAVSGLKVSQYLNVFYDFVDQKSFERKIEEAIISKNWSRDKAVRTTTDARALIILAGKLNGIFFDKMVVLRDPQDGTMYTMVSDYINENNEVTQYCVKKIEKSQP